MPSINLSGDTIHTCKQYPINNHSKALTPFCWDKVCEGNVMDDQPNFVNYMMLKHVHAHFFLSHI